MPARPTPAQLAAWRALLVTHTRVTRRLDHELEAAHGFGIEWYDVLLQLHEAGGGRTMSDLADAVLLSRPNCTRLVDRMAASGLVTRRADEHDARVRWAMLTDEGRAELRRAAPTHLAGIARHFARHVDAAAAATLTDVLTSVADGMDDGASG